MARVRHEEGRHAEARPLGHRLHRVQPCRHRLRVGVRPVDELTHVPAEDRFRRSRRVEDGRPAGERVRPVDRLLVERAAGAHLERRADHEPGLLLERHPTDEVGHALLDGPAPVLVGVELAVLVEVLEEKAVDLQQRGDPRSHLGLRDASRRERAAAEEKGRRGEPAGETRERRAHRRPPGSGPTTPGAVSARARPFSSDRTEPATAGAPPGRPSSRRPPSRSRRRPSRDRPAPRRGRRGVPPSPGPRGRRGRSRAR